MPREVVAGHAKRLMEPFLGKLWPCRQQLLFVALRAQDCGRAERDSSAPVIQTSIFSGNFNGVVDLDAEVAHGALDLGVSEQKLDCAQVPRSSIDQCRLRWPQRVGAELEGIEGGLRDPLPDEPSILPRGEPARRLAAPGNRN